MIQVNVSFIELYENKKEVNIIHIMILSVLEIVIQIYEKQ
jgi:hypothetical protein